MSNYSRIYGWVALLASAIIVVYLAGCGRFWVPVNTGSGSNGSGSSGSGTTSQIAFVANNNTTSGNSDSIGIFDVNSSGQFSAVGTNVPVSPGVGVSSLVVVAGYLYVGDFTNSQINGYSIASNGALTALSGFPLTITAGGSPVSLAGANVNGSSHLYVLTTSALGTVVTVYNVTSSTGALTQQTTTYSLASTSSQAIRVSPNGQNVYVAMGALNGVQVYTINNDGSLTSQGTLGISASLSSAYDIVINSSSTQAYVADFTAGQVVHCTVGTNGSLTVNSGADYSTGTGPISLTIDHSGSYLYVANQSSNNVSGFSIASNGNLTAVTGSPFSAGSSPRWVQADTTGQYVFVANSGGSPDVSVFSEASGTGVLTSNGTANTGGSAVAIFVQQ